MKQLFVLFVLAICFNSCTIKMEDIPEQPVTVNAPFQKCQAFDLETKSGYKYSVYSKTDSSVYTNIIVLEFNNYGVVIAVQKHILLKTDILTIVYKYKCYPSMIQ